MILRLIVKKYDSEVYVEKAVALIPTRTKNECVAQLLKMEKRQGKKTIRDEAASNLFANELLHALNNGTDSGRGHCAEDHVSDCWYRSGKTPANSLGGGVPRKSN